MLKKQGFVEKNVISLVTVLNMRLEGKSPEDVEVGLQIGYDLVITGFRRLDDPNFYEASGVKDIFESINGMMSAWSLEHNTPLTVPGTYYAPEEHVIFEPVYDKEIEEPTLFCIVNEKTGRLDVLQIRYSAPENWYTISTIWLTA